MGKVITRTNGIVTQVWKDNEASWSFFMGRMSRDIQWQNIDLRPVSPKVFRDFGEAKWYLDMRLKHLNTAMRREESEWTYRIISEEDIK